MIAEIKFQIYNLFFSLKKPNKLQDFLKWHTSLTFMINTIKFVDAGIKTIFLFQNMIIL